MSVKKTKMAVGGGLLAVGLLTVACAALGISGTFFRV